MGIKKRKGKFNFRKIAYCGPDELVDRLDLEGCGYKIRKMVAISALGSLCLNKRSRNFVVDKDYGKKNIT